MDAVPASPTPPHPSWVHRWWGKALLAWIFLTVVTAALFLFFFIDNLLGTSPIPAGASRFTELTRAVNATLPGAGSLVRDDDPRLGNPAAKLTIVAFEDFECPFSGEVFPTLRQVMVEHADDVLFVYRDFPITDVHPDAQRAAEAAQCALLQGKFWEYHDRLFQHQNALSSDDLVTYAEQVGLDLVDFATCLDRGQTRATVLQDFDDGVALGVRGTPTFFFNGQKVEGSLPRDAFEEIISAFLSS
ncbi:MAG: DsbA family protein [Candidatus Kerfeldbacteria bacterium]|nr:DsbA family protein [Candidatus Kerfeldbacteria bacterium]